MEKTETAPKKQVNLLTRILIYIGIPIVIIYGISSFITLYNVNTSITGLTEKQLATESDAAANEIAGAFNKYLEITRQMAVNSQFEDVTAEIMPGMDPMAAPGFAKAEKSLSGVKASDPNILDAWVGDPDSNNLLLSKGFYASPDWIMVERPWYTQMMDVGGTTMTAPYVDALTSKMVVTAVSPIYRAGTKDVISATGLDFTLDSVSAMMSEYKLGETGFFILASADGQLIYHPNQEYINTNIKDSNMSDNIKDAVLTQKTGAIEYSSEGLHNHGYVAMVGNTGWTITTGLPDKEFNSAYNLIQLITFIIMLIVIVGMVLLTAFTSKKIAKPINMLAGVANKLAVGNVEVSTDGIAAISSEITELTAAFGEMADNTREQAMAAERIAAGDLMMDVIPRSDQDVLGISMADMVKSLRELIQETEMLTAAAVAGRLSVRGNTDALNGGYRDIIAGFNATLDAVIEPLNMASGYIDRIGKGEIPEKINQEAKGDFAALRNSINSCIDGLGALTEGNEVLALMSKNDLTQRIDAEYSGIYGEIAKSINTIQDSLIIVVRAVDDISNGDMKMLDGLKATGRLSENDRLIPGFIMLMENIIMLLEESDSMAKAAVAGDLNNRAHASRFPGDYAKVINGFNNTLDALTEPMQEASQVLNELAQGNLNTAMVGDYLGQNGQIKEDMNKTIAFLKQYVHEISETLEKVSNGDFNQEITANYLGDFVTIKHAINDITAHLSEILTEIGNSANQVEAGSRQISDGGQALAQGTTEQASAIQQLSASIDEVAEETKKNAQNANAANERTLEVRATAEAGNKQMGDMVNAMEAINEASHNISKIIKVIDDIAFQTNILALNAAVEAARAGQHGKGFAVVAEEVRSLAARSADAAHETTGLIEGSIDKVEAGAKIANDTADSLEGILKSVAKVTDLVSNIAVASNDQATSIAQITQGIEQVSQVVQTNSATAEESAAASEELSGQAELLKNMVSEFKLKGISSSAASSRQPVASAPQEITEQVSHQPAKPQIILDDMEMDKY
ncbi:methyl-accepting chemotaxis protein [Acetobacterium sp.]|uniref:methyl-accepting chemotaxis protein n=1 Tax=Acetobacterium sp. TaxID=1872094 RepID=UPI00271D2353|nr:methyl-accepting chemotaxis protein [Acetobacterium sp.]MDO9493925.1 methyl-accepting chemotaxis protein [Acetobacterium sp.]